jgi:hypothetical protein
MTIGKERERKREKTLEVSNEVLVLLMTIEWEEENSWASSVLGLFQRLFITV